MGATATPSLRRRSSKQNAPRAQIQREATVAPLDWWGHDRVDRVEQRYEMWEESHASADSLYAAGVTCIGRLSFSADGGHEDVENARFAGVDPKQTDADAAVKLLLNYWRIPQPSVLFSVTGSAQFIDLEPRLDNLLLEGIQAAAASTRAWIVTGGFDCGIMEVMGRALRARSSLSQRMQHSASLEEESGARMWTTPLIGVTPMPKVTGYRDLADRDAEHPNVATPVLYSKEVPLMATDCH